MSDDMLDQLFKIAVQNGIAAIFLFLVVLFYIREKRAWDLERTAFIKALSDRDALRIEDAKIGFTTLREMQTRVQDGIASLTNIQATATLQRELITKVSEASAIVEHLERIRDQAASSAAPRTLGPGQRPQR